MHGERSPFKGRRFTAEVILWVVRWYLRFPINYRNLERMLADRDVMVGHTTLYRWSQAYTPELDKRVRPHLRQTTGSWRAGGPTCTVPSMGAGRRSTSCSASSLMPRARSVSSARRSNKPIRSTRTTKAMKKDGELWRFAKLRQTKYLDNIVEQGHTCSVLLSEGAKTGTTFTQPPALQQNLSARYSYCWSPYSRFPG